MTVYLFQVVEENTPKSLFFCKFEETFKEQSFRIHSIYSSSRSKMEDKGKKMNLQTRTHKSHGRTIVAGNRLQENLVKSVSCRFCHADVTQLLENVSTSSGLSSSWIVSYKNKHWPSRNSSENLLTNLVACKRRNSDLAKDVFHQEQNLSPLCN